MTKSKIENLQSSVEFAGNLFQFYMNVYQLSWGWASSVRNKHIEDTELVHCSQIFFYYSIKHRIWDTKCIVHQKNIIFYKYNEVDLFLFRRHAENAARMLYADFFQAIIANPPFGLVQEVKSLPNLQEMKGKITNHCAHTSL